MSKELDLQVAKYVMKYGGDVERSEYYWEDLNFNPSTNIVDAHKVIEKLKRDGFYILIDCGGDKHTYRCMLSIHGIVYKYEADTAPLAISQASFQTVGFTINEYHRQA